MGGNRLNADVKERQMVFYISVIVYVLLVYTTNYKPIEIAYSLVFLGGIMLVRNLKDLFRKS
jgi:hypothetical protein